jgi:hypothetical protein
MSVKSRISTTPNSVVGNTEILQKSGHSEPPVKNEERFISGIAVWRTLGGERG